MDRIYTFKEAKELIKTYDSLFRRLTSSGTYVGTYKGKIVNDVRYLLKNYFFQNKLLNDFKNGAVSEINYMETEQLFKDMYCCFRSQDLYVKCAKLYNENSPEILANLKQLKCGKNIILWLFASNQKKENAERSYTYLKNTLSSDFYKESNETYNSFLELEKIEQNAVDMDVCQDTHKYKGLLFSLYPEKTQNGNIVSIIKSIKDDYNNILSQQSKIAEMLDSTKLDIRKFLDVLISVETMNMIRSIPVEELNRNKNGIHVKTLRNNGFRNVADVYTSSVSRLEAVQGISYAGAVTIKNIAENYAREATKNVKIKLSVDNKDKVSTNVVQIVNKYLKQKEIIKSVNDLIKEYKSEIEKNIDKIFETPDGVKYYFSDTEEKKQYMQAYFKAKGILNSTEFGLKLKELYQRYYAIRLCGANEVWQDFSANLVKYYNAIEEIYPGLLGNDDTYYGLPEGLAREVQNEEYSLEGLTCTLRHYQEMGVKYILHQGRVLLGDEMGLGKTVQAIAAMVSLRNKGATHYMVICPASVVVNWSREVTRHSDLKPIVVHGKDRVSALRKWIKDGGVAVTTYEGTEYIDLADNFDFSLLVVDEAHYIKNPKARRSANSERISLHADRILFMTGTALENKVDEMIYLIKMLNLPIARYASDKAYLSSAPKFREMIAPVYYRRKRDDVLTELPELIETKEWCRLGKEEESVYENSVLTCCLPEIRRVSWNVENLCFSSKATRLKELVDEAKDDGRKIIVFSFFLNTIHKIRDFLGDICTESITGAVSSQRRQEIIDEFDRAPAGKVLISQIIAGGTGLNIQSASVVIICEPQFKPSTENQAISRAYRMGQSRNVLVYRLLCENTIDERITDLLEKKQKIFNEFADRSVAAERDKSVEVNDKAFSELVKDEVERIKRKHNV